jgi:hypothetical protein
VRSHTSTRSGLATTSDVSASVRLATLTVCEMGVGVSACCQLWSGRGRTEAMYSIACAFYWRMSYEQIRCGRW